MTFETPVGSEFELTVLQKIQAGEEDMKVILRNPRREVELVGSRRVRELLKELDILPDTVLVIRGEELLTTDQVVGEADEIEIRPAISGGAR